MEHYQVDIRVNGQSMKAEVTVAETLLEVLRDKLGAAEVKNGCGQGDCGACTVLLDGEAVNSCLTLAVQADGRAVTTVRGLGTPDDPHPLQESFVKHGAIQCGFCTSGVVLSAKALLDENPTPSRAEIREGISGNLCRCTGYTKIVDAIENVATHPELLGGRSR
jgi:aerobic-type carbon monoxide dehydrogenase small subunit (CoxS/CutS family)